MHDQDLLDAIQLALERDRAACKQPRKITELRERFESLTGGEQELLPLVVSGQLNKQIAAELGNSEIS